MLRLSLGCEPSPVTERASHYGFGPQLFQHGEYHAGWGSSTYELFERLYDITEDDWQDPNFMASLEEQVQNMLDAGFINTDTHAGNLMKRTVPAHEYSRLRTPSARSRAQELSRNPNTQDVLVSEFVFVDNDIGNSDNERENAEYEQLGVGEKLFWWVNPEHRRKVFQFAKVIRESSLRRLRWK